MEVLTLGSLLTKMTSAWFTEDGTVVTAQSPSGLEQSCGIYIYIFFFSFFLMLRTRAHNLGFMCPETTCLACSGELGRCSL